VIDADDLVRLAANQRWFRSKARTRTGAEIVETIALHELAIVLLRVDYTEGAPETYVIPVDANGRDAIADPRLAAALLRVMRDGGGGRLTGTALPALRELPPDTPLPSRASTAEQTNSSIIFGDRFMLKIFRVLEAEPSLEYEMGRFLSTREPPYRGSPRLAGALEVGNSTLGTLFEFVPNQGDAWKLTLAALAGPDPDEHLARIRLLGRRTAELHRVLASDASDPTFAPEPFDLAHQQAIHDGARADLEHMLELLRDRTDPLAAQIVARRGDLEQLLARVTERPLAAVRTRTHGDYHLGQVLWTGEDFLIIDFEGEPSQPLAVRRSKRSPLRDVAGMLRSLDYAAGTAKAPEWTERATRAFLEGYGPVDDALVRVFLLEKAVYEIAYELNNRPDWVAIPMRGLLALLEGS
jgi:maltose alpha-D-glucosyltransferase/alpha-amylase